MKHTKFIIALLILHSQFLILNSLQAQLRVSGIFADNMVIQQNEPVKIWGWASVGEKITVEFAGKTAIAKTQKDGSWEVVLPATKTASAPFILEIKTKKESVKFQNILVGEVWLCAGQSNMEWTVAQSADAEKEIAAADYPEIRSFRVPKGIKNEPQQNLSGKWEVCSPETAGNFSGVAYFYARELYKKLGVPIGIINASWGGTDIETWMDGNTVEALQATPLQMKPYNDEVMNNIETYINENKGSREAFNKAMANDPALEEKWFSNLYDFSGWGEIPVPAEWSRTPLSLVDGQVWFKYTVNIPEEYENLPAVLSLGTIDDADKAWLNGEFLGENTGWDVPRLYPVKKGLLKAGKNTITVRITDNGSSGGMWSPAEDIFLKIQDGEKTPVFSLAGTWKYKESVTNTKYKVLEISPNMVYSCLFNTMINPITNFRIKGAIWYQGESNVSRAYAYRTLFPAMINSWRTHWGYDFPFYWVQLANLYPHPAKPVESDWAELREAQTMALALPKTGQAVIYDIGDAGSIHPLNKQDVGKRLALHAFHNEYGDTDIVSQSPVYKSAEIIGNKIVISFNLYGSKLKTDDTFGYLRGFSIAGNDRKFDWAKAELDGDQIVVFSPNVPNPVAVRYAWANNPDANLLNTEGLPVTPFRTDNWAGKTAPKSAISGNKPKSIEEKADSVLVLMTLDEKIGQLNQLSGNWQTGPMLRGDQNKIDLLKTGKIGSMLNIKGSQNTREIQALALQSRLKIPLLFGLDVIHGYRTVFPVPLAQAASFDREVIEKAARVSARESVVSGVHWTFSPMLDVSRDPRWGRVMEGAGEDTYWAAEVARVMVRGYQKPFSDGLELMACAKHFAAYAAAIGGRDYNTVDMSMQTLQNVILPPFKAASDEKIASFMCSFNDINGVPSSANHFLYHTLYNEWGFNGLVVSDWGSIGEMVAHGYSKDREMAAAQAINSGVTIDMESNCYIDHLKKLVEKGVVAEQTINREVKRVLVQKFKLGLFDNPYKYCVPEKESAEILSKENRKAALDVARKSVILLKNDMDAHAGALLPIATLPKKIALIGPLADSKADMDGNWSVAFETHVAVTLLDALKNRYQNATVTYSKGCEFKGEDKSRFEEAVKTAKEADLVILALGEQFGMSGEARSRGDIHLPGVQEELACRVYEANPHTVTVLLAGRPLIFNEIAAKAPAILYAWYLGSESGNAILDIIEGRYNPSARVPMSFPKHIGQIPVYYNRKNTGRPPVDVEGNYSSRYIDIDYKPQYPFGYGLSYTTFHYENIKIRSGKDTIFIDVTLKNTGDYDGKELVQVYFRKLWGESTRPVKELKAVENVFLKKGETRKITLDVPYERLKYYGQNGWQSGAGDYEIYLGRNAEDLFFFNPYCSFL
ncbi:MAG: glycoside hydrolase family 3 C-terminal domain-containing protein [Dysgonamonadaceae bacterium]|jgi:beta-glucosidase-like glycosyl hydrolase|nr:glycoside hydrolase family 3 C-terminal domain-containing protein [Dysgonamonadaceae bacterium]